MLQQVVVNYTEEKQLFQQLLADDQDPNILLFQGESGMGKSTLIRHCLTSAETLPTLYIELQGGDASLAHVFARIIQNCNPYPLTKFFDTLAKVLDKPNLTNDPLWQKKVRVHLHQISLISDTERRHNMFHRLTEAWFDDTWQFESPFTLCIDNYEKASTEFKRWFTDDFLNGVAFTTKIRVIVGGCTVPEHEKTSWGDCTKHRTLEGIKIPKEWEPWIEANGYELTSYEALKIIVDENKGKPEVITNTIHLEFPRHNSNRFKDKLPSEKRKLIRELITGLFTLSELKNICFDMGIDYENLPEHDKKHGFVRELLMHTSRISRYEEFIQACREERPEAGW